MSALFGPNMDLIESSMRFRVARQSVLSSNVANADTPAYRRFDLVFDALEQGGNGVRLATTHSAHVPTSASAGGGYGVERGDYGDRPDRNGVDLDQELLQLSRNAGKFKQQAEVLTRLLTLRRIAVTGEAR